MNLAEQMNQSLAEQLKLLKLTTFERKYLSLAERYSNQGKTHIEYLQELVNQEAEYRYQRRVAKFLSKAKLPRNKLLTDFDASRIPGLSKITLDRLAKGDFIDRYENILIFGNPGTGKTHLSIGLAREWCLLGRSVHYVTAANLVQQLLQAKTNLRLEQFIKKMDGFEVLLIDDISYVPYDRQETDVLFTLLSARYEMRSVLITSNCPFAKWNTIFKDEMTTTAAVDRLVHHSTILELNAESYRVAQARKKSKKINPSPDKEVSEKA